MPPILSSPRAPRAKSEVFARNVCVVVNYRRVDRARDERVRRTDDRGDALVEGFFRWRLEFVPARGNSKSFTPAALPGRTPSRRRANPRGIRRETAAAPRIAPRARHSLRDRRSSRARECMAQCAAPLANPLAALSAGRARAARTVPKMRTTANSGGWAMRFRTLSRIRTVPSGVVLVTDQFESRLG
jgi:hypothetical protein